MKTEIIKINRSKGQDFLSVSQDCYEKAEKENKNFILDGRNKVQLIKPNSSITASLDAVYGGWEFNTGKKCKSKKEAMEYIQKSLNMV